MRQMIFLAGPRQVGKTTTSLQVGEDAHDFYYFNWDSREDRELILKGPQALAEAADLLKVRKQKPILILDEIHKFGNWKQFLKGFFDIYSIKCHILVTGSAKLNIYKRTGDSLMGRYFFYRIHPLSIGEILRPEVSPQLIRAPKKISEKKLSQLIEFGGFPEPFLKMNQRFSTNWKRSRQEQLVFEDIRDLSHIQELAQLEMLSEVLRDTVSQQVSFSSLANLVNVSQPTITRWLNTLESFYYCFPVRPWSKNIKRSLRKEPKYYLWDWSLSKKSGARLENFIASHLLKAVHFWTDYGLGEFDLHYLRDKNKREVDFLVTKDQTPWFLVEVKSSDNKGISKSLYYFQEQTRAPHAFQVCFNSKYEDVDCFSYKEPVIVPASTFLSQLV
ncbi:MAG: hypothetical protein S4CHLAM123_12630 [Chlamydiales bacterium]|nr:hypothetical protein [Chlamydiales bacterium]